MPNSRTATAGYLSTATLEFVGEALESIIRNLRVICNSALSQADVESERLESISRLFGQSPDGLDDDEVREALGQIDEVKNTIDAVPDEHPFAFRITRSSAWIENHALEPSPITPSANVWFAVGGALEELKLEN